MDLSHDGWWILAFISPVLEVLGMAMGSASIWHRPLLISAMGYFSPCSDWMDCFSSCSDWIDCFSSCSDWMGCFKPCSDSMAALVRVLIGWAALVRVLIGCESR